MRFLTNDWFALHRTARPSIDWTGAIAALDV
jgi:hypothetical protein